MAEGEIIKQATEAPKALFSWVKKYWWAGPLLVFGLIGVGMAIKPWFTRVTTSTTTGALPGDRLGTFFRNLLRISGFIVPIGFVLLGSEMAYASICCAEHVPQILANSTGWFSQVWGYLAGLGFLSVGFGIVARLQSPDTLDCKTENRGRVLNYTPGDAQETSFFIRSNTKHTAASGKPLVATDITVALDTTVEQVNTGTNPVKAQDLARLLGYMELSTPFHGTILDKKTGTGPMLDLVINFFGQGFGRSGDAPIETITVPTDPTSDVPITKYFTFPFKQHVLQDTIACCPWLKSLDNGEIKLQIAACNALGPVSTGAITKSASTVRAGVGYARSPFWRQHYVPYTRLDTPSSGSDGLEFKNFGGTGPSSTKAVDMVHSILQLSSLAGLPGNVAGFSALTNIVAPDFGLDDVLNIDFLVKNRLDSQFESRVGNYDYATGGNHVQGTANNGMALDKLLFLAVLQGALKMNIQELPKLDKDKKLNLREAGLEGRTGQDAFAVLGYRELSGAKMQELSLMSGNLIPGDYINGRTYIPTGK